MKTTKNNYAFIDSQNLNLGVRNLGWALDFVRFRRYLAEKYHVSTAYLFIGYLVENQDLYLSLQKSGYILIFKPVLKYKNGCVKGNVDAELVLQAMIDYENYDQAIIVTSDGDFACLVNYLYQQDKLRQVISPHKDTCSKLLKQAAKDKIVFMNNLKDKLEYKKAPQKDETC
ncbi:MAG: NYN domain-containing protein [Chloroflexi bacterium]|nr:NYN domain-containing protein [Chloroflexota bacterium]